MAKVVPTSEPGAHGAHGRRKTMQIMARLAMLALTGCAIGGSAEYRILDSWRGESVDKVFLRWGLPTRQATLGDGSTMYEWDNAEAVVIPGQVHATATTIGSSTYINATTTPSFAVSARCTRSFVTTSDRIIVEGYSHGGNCCVMAIAGQCARLANPARK